jgi:hypothetical protein
VTATRRRMFEVTRVRRVLTAVIVVLFVQFVHRTVASYFLVHPQSLL